MAKRVYFAFHYQDVIDFRANVVRNHNFIEGVESAGYYDHSVWEEAKLKSPTALRNLIDGEILGTSVTVVLIGTGTWARRWVRYEIFKSVIRGNRLFGVHINSVRGRDGCTKLSGPNPFNNLAVKCSVTGDLITPTEWNGSEWVPSSDVSPYIPANNPNPNKGQHLKLSVWHPVYDWSFDKGYENFESWLEK